MLEEKPKTRDEIIKERISNWRQWGIEKAVALCMAGRIEASELEDVAERIYLYTAFPHSTKS